MADMTILDALQAFHRELVALNEGHGDGSTIDNEALVENFERELERVWERPRRSEESRNSIKSGKIVLDGTEFSINDDFQRDALILADELEIEELDAARFLLDSHDDIPILGRPLFECAIIRFHQQRKYALDILRLLFEIYSLENNDEESTPLDGIKAYVEARMLQASATGQKRNVPRYMTAMAEIKTSLQKLGDKIAAAQAMGQIIMSEEMETVEYSRISLIQQHESLAVILCRAVSKRQAETADFMNFVGILKRADKYDCLLVHLLPALGAFTVQFGSPESGMDLTRAQDIHSKLFAAADDSAWPLPYLQAAFKAWWLAEYSGYWADEPSGLPDSEVVKEDRERSKAFVDALKDGAFDFLLTAATDVRAPDWHDPVRAGMRKWLQRKSTPLPADVVQFSDYLQLRFMCQLELFVESFISNMPDVLRKLRVEEDEQRQLSQVHEQDLDLERFLLIIAYAYERRPDSAAAFWTDPDSNMAGFMHWASRRASTPLVAAFCEMLQAISENDECATAAHEFLLDEGHHSSGKMRRTQSLTWSQIFRELEFFAEKIKQKPMATPTTRYRNVKPSTDVVETEPESAMMLECYLRLMTKLASESETARQFLLRNSEYSVVDKFLELASSQIPSRLRGCIFMALKALITRKTLEESNLMWLCLDNWSTGQYTQPLAHPSGSLRQGQAQPIVSMDRILDEMSNGFEEPEALTKLLLALVSPAVDESPLNDSLPFGDTLGASARGIEAYVDFVVGQVFATKSQDLQDIYQTRVLRLTCLEFMLTCLNTFNEDLIVMANATNLAIDSSIATVDLATYVTKHPFARVMEWMYNDKVMTALFNSIHQTPMEVGNAAPDSPLILGVLRAVELISKVMDLETTYLDLVRPLIKKNNPQRQPVANAPYASFGDGLVTRLSLVVDLGNYCGIGHSELTLACLQLLGRMSSSSRIASEWSGSARAGHRNKAVVAMEANGEHESIARAFISELQAPLEPGREADSTSYITKCYVLDFLLQCLKETPKRPTIAHLLLGFKCGADSLSIENGGAFAKRFSLFHTLISLLMELPSADAQGMRGPLISLKRRAMRIMQVLWSSPLSSKLVIQELRDNEFFFHLLVRETIIQPNIPWEGQDVAVAYFPLTSGSLALSDFLVLRRMVLEYFAMELCMISQGRMPSVKRRIFEALNGQILDDENERIQTPTIFDLYDFPPPSNLWEVPSPQIEFYQDLDITICLQDDGDGNRMHNLDRVKEMLLIKRNEKSRGQFKEVLATTQSIAAIEREEVMIHEHLASTDRQQQLARQSLEVLRSWTKLLLIMVECNDFEGTARTTFFLQTLQAILPSLELFASDRPVEAMDLANLARILLSRLDLKESSTADKQGRAIGNLIHDKLFQLFEICLQAISKWAGGQELRAVYYEICYRYITGAPDETKSSFNMQIIKTVRVYGERFISAMCDDAICGEPSSQAAVYILFNVLVNVGRQEGDEYVVDMLNRLNFIGIAVDTLRSVMADWHGVCARGDAGQQNHLDAKLALLLQLAQTRAGAQYVLHASIIRIVELSGLFAADPELQQLRGDDSRALERHYDLLAKIVRIIGAALLCRGSHSIVQGRKFLTDHRMLVAHTLKRSAGIGAHADGADGTGVLENKVEELADAFMVVIAATGFIEFDNEAIPELNTTRKLFH
ncbi:nuclear pore complex subunit [Cordyceps militaris]|uniref:Nuclear pore complex subunit n=1 Tax=Cordyceps militaris TaxID=73501 RepID=A0A2H4SWA1_CORMI|nr:nuclear pore complex subunit [Cordyceps militaris]